ncbi:GNAT family N-acetyltransferase [Arthrobacter sp. CAN_C5]|uniref:GNAT family N-acetyltransferase n=1 Tax=Arthrobacter sp. CAN_C5 TaxID=2760706 RepID=UPI001AE26AEF
MGRTDWPSVEDIYRDGIATGHATFEREPPTWKNFDAGRLANQRLVAVDGGTILGWAAASATSSREAYQGVVEHSVYVAPQARGRGVGNALLEALVDSAEKAGIWTIQSGIFPENAGSLRLHAVHGFRIVGRRERLALMTYGPQEGTWRDVFLVERRSQVIAP